MGSASSSGGRGLGWEKAESRKRRKNKIITWKREKKWRIITAGDGLSCKRTHNRVLHQFLSEEPASDSTVEVSLRCSGFAAIKFLPPPFLTPKKKVNKNDEWVDFCSVKKQTYGRFQLACFPFFLKGEIRGSIWALCLGIFSFQQCYGAVLVKEAPCTSARSHIKMCNCGAASRIVHSGRFQTADKSES